MPNQYVKRITTTGLCQSILIGGVPTLEEHILNAFYLHRCRNGVDFVLLDKIGNTLAESHKRPFTESEVHHGLEDETGLLVI